MEIPKFDWNAPSYEGLGLQSAMSLIFRALRNLHARVTICERRIQRLAKNEDVIAEKLGLRVEKEAEEG